MPPPRDARRRHPGLRGEAAQSLAERIASGRAPTLVPSLRNANAGARYDSAEVDLLATLEDADLAAAARRELEVVVAHDRATRVVQLDTERLARARVGNHSSVVDVFERNAGLAPFADVPVDER